MSTVTLNDVVYRLDVIRFPNNATDFICSTSDDVLGILTGQLMAGQGYASFIVGQEIPAGGASLFEGIATRIVGDKTYAVNCVYQLHLCERADDVNPVVVDNELAGKLLLQAIADLSGYKGDLDSLTILAAGDLAHSIVGDEIHYMVGDIVFSKGKVPQQ